MEVSFKKTVEVNYNFDPICLAQDLVKHYMKENYNQLDEGIFDYVDDHILDAMSAHGLSDEDYEIISDFNEENDYYEDDITYELSEAVKNTIKKFLIF